MPEIRPLSRFARLIGYDGAMKFHFSTSSLWLTAAFFAVWLAAVAAVFRKTGITVQSLLHLLIVPAAYAYFWVPCLFVAYWLGGKRATWTSMLIFAVAEAGAVIFIVFDVGMHLYRYVYNNW